MKKIRVLIIEDSAATRQLLEHIVSQDPRLEIAAAVPTAEEALRILTRVSPDVISMDIRLPGMNGFEATQRIMQKRPTPVVVVSASVDRPEMQITMNALRAGALTVLEKPRGLTSHEYAVMAERLCTQLAIMSQVKVVRRHANAQPVACATRLPRMAPGNFRVLAVASSTGGPAALVQLLGGLGEEFPLPILMVQHITGSFLEGFATWLNNTCPFAVEIVRDRTPIAPRTVYLAKQDHHLRAENQIARVDDGEPVCGQRPSGTVLFDSLARTHGSQALGVILTGMGTDGAEGLLRLRESGGHTIAEDESTAVVYGMPGEAVRLGAAVESLPLPAIARRIRELTSVTREAA
jgi:two-component system, chemotaxis family, protein-glutamate methylesterase/glutaminase